MSAGASGSTATGPATGSASSRSANGVAPAGSVAGRRVADDQPQRRRAVGRAASSYVRRGSRCARSGRR